MIFDLFLAEKVVASVPSDAEKYKPIIIIAVVAALLILSLSAVFILRNRK